MKQMLVRSVDDDTAERFTRKAHVEGKSAEQVLRELIRAYARPSRQAALQVLDEIRATANPDKVIDPVKSIREDRGADHGRL